MKKIILILTLALFSPVIYGQNQQRIDSLKESLSFQTSAIKKLEILKDLSWLSVSENPKEAIKYAEQGLTLSNNELNYFKPTFYSTLGSAHKLLNKLNKSIEYYKRSIIESELIGSEIAIINNLNSLGIIYKNISKRDSAMIYYNKALHKLLSLNEKEIDYNLLGAIKINRGVIFKFTNDSLALNEFLEVEKLYKENDITDELVDVYSNIAMVFFDLKDYAKCIEYHRKSIEIDKKNNSTKWLAYDYGELSSVYAAIYKLDSSLYYATKSNKLALQINDIDQIGYTHMLLGNYYYLKEDYINSIYNFKTSLSYSYKLKNNDYKITNHIGLANSYLQLKKPLKIKFHLDSSSYINKISENQKNFKAIQNSYMKFYFLVGKVNLALKASKVLDSLNKIEFEKEKQEIIYNLETKYQTQQKENEILTLTNDNLIAETNLTQSKYLNFGALGLLLFLSGLGYFYWDKKKQAHKIELLENTVVVGEQEKNRIGKELHDGIAGTLIKLVHDSENNQMELSHKLLKTYNEVRELSHQLDNTSMHNELFIDRIEEIIPINNAKQVFNFKVSPINLQLAEPYGTHFYRIIQELIANNIKHAKANETTINIELNNASLFLNYTDNGIGIKDIKERNGISNIRNRVTLMQGNLTINNLEKGCDIKFDIPYTI